MNGHARREDGKERPLRTSDFVLIPDQDHFFAEAHDPDSGSSYVVSAPVLSHHHSSGSPSFAPEEVEEVTHIVPGFVHTRAETVDAINKALGTEFDMTEFQGWD